jgi:hypothetical protein
VQQESESAYSSWAKWIAMGAYLGVAVVAFALFAFAEPLADDYCTAASRVDVSEYVGNLYLNWSGRWFSHTLEHLALTRVDPTQTYGILTAILTLFLAVGVYLFVNTLFGKDLSPGLVVALSGSFLVVFWCLHPSLGQGFYWFTGAVEYQLVVALALLLFAALLSEPVASSRGLVRVLYAVSLPLLAFLITGMHELFAAMLCVVLAVGVVVAYRVRHRNRALWVFALAASVVGLGVSVGAAGNLVRTASFAADRDWLLAFWLTPWQAVKAGTRWIFDLKLMAATVLFLMHPRIRAARPSWLASGASWKKIIPLTWVALLAVGFAMPTFAMSQEMPGRALGGIFLVFLLGWFLTVFVWTRDLQVLDALPPGTARNVGSVLLLVFALSLLTTGNTRDGIHDLIHTAPAWQRAVRERYQLIRQAASEGRSVVAVPQSPPRPRIFFQGPAEITGQRADWKNACMASFFEVPAVRTQDGSASPASGR